MSKTLIQIRLLLAVSDLDLHYALAILSISFEAISTLYYKTFLLEQYFGCQAKQVDQHLYLSLVVRKPVFGVSDQVPHKPGCTFTEDG